MEEIDPQRYVLPALLAVLFLGAFLILVTSGGSDEPAGAVDRPARSTTTTKQQAAANAGRQADRVADPERGEALRQGPGRRHPDVDRRGGGDDRRAAARAQPQRRSRLAEARADAQARTVTARVALLRAVLALLLLSPGAAAQSPSGAPRLVGAKAAILMEASTGDILLSRDRNQRRQIASTTKLMTVLVALERDDLDDVFSAADYRPAPAESQIGLRRGERMSVRDLLRATLLPSANDAAATLAVGTMGSTAAFVARDEPARPAARPAQHAASPTRSASTTPTTTRPRTTSPSSRCSCAATSSSAARSTSRRDAAQRRAEAHRGQPQRARAPRRRRQRREDRVHARGPATSSSARPAATA